MIQYAFTYWNKNGIETNIFHISDLLFISNRDRVGSPGFMDTANNVNPEFNNCHFVIDIDSLDRKFDYLRIYSIHRSTLNQPVANIVTDINLNELPSTQTSIQITDTGRNKSSFDINALLMIGGEELVVGTISTKDNVLFAGNICVPRIPLDINTKDKFTYKEIVNTHHIPFVDNVYNYIVYTLTDKVIKH